MRTAIPFIAAGVLAMACTGQPVVQAASETDALFSFESPAPQPDDRPEAARNFDFLLGTWTVRNRTLAERLKGSDDWNEWEAAMHVVPILGGYGNVGRIRAERDGQTFEGVGVRLYDPTTGHWSLSWIDRSGRILPQAGGPMEDSGGVGYGEEEFEGETVRLRFRWSHETPDRAHWDQSYQAPDGSWEVNWTMDFKRPRTTNSGHSG